MRFDELTKKPAKPQRPLTYTESLQVKLDAYSAVKPAPKFTAVEWAIMEGGGSLDEGWKDTLGSLAIAGGVALGGAGGMAAKDAMTSPKGAATAPTTKQVTAPVVKKELPKVVAKQATPAPAKAVQVTAITDNPLESVLLKAAKGAGLKGPELAAFMAQCAHETLDFKRLTEFGGSLDFRKYDPKYAPKKAKALGNKVAGDGARYKGRGFIQITGRYNYKKAGEELGLPLEKNPALAEKPEIAAKIAVWFWQHRVQPNVDNFHDVSSVTKTINPGMRGLQDRKDNFKAYMQTAAAGQPPKDAS